MAESRSEVDVADLQHSLRECIERARAGQQVIVTDGGRPVAGSHRSTSWLTGWPSSWPQASRRTRIYSEGSPSASAPHRAGGLGERLHRRAATLNSATHGPPPWRSQDSDRAPRAGDGRNGAITSGAAIAGEASPRDRHLCASEQRRLDGQPLSRVRRRSGRTRRLVRRGRPG
jgi:antitoxin (DNA-binding transcriptional repressor) of toxin-antitoxin stability system